MAYWCGKRLVISASRSGETIEFPLEMPYARIGSHERSDVILDDVPRNALFLLGIQTGVFSLPLMAPQNDGAFHRGWIDEERTIACGPWSLRVRFDDSSPMLPAAESLDVDLKSNTDVPVWLIRREGKELGRHRQRRRLMLIGREQPSDFRLRTNYISAGHCISYWDGRCAWVIDMCSTNGSRKDGVRFHVAKLRRGRSVHLGPLELKFENTEKAVPKSSDRNRADSVIDLPAASPRDEPANSVSDLAEPPASSQMPISQDQQNHVDAGAILDHGRHLEDWEARLSKQELLIEQAAAKLEERRTEFQSDQERLSELRNELESERAELATQQEKLGSQSASVEEQSLEVEQRAADLVQQNQDLENAKNALQQRQIDIDADQAKTEQRKQEIQAALERVKDLESRQTQLDANVQKLEQRDAELAVAEEQSAEDRDLLQSQRKELEQLQRACAERQTEITSLQQDLQKKESELLARESSIQKQLSEFDRQANSIEAQQQELLDREQRARDEKRQLQSQAELFEERKREFDQELELWRTEQASEERKRQQQTHLDEQLAAKSADQEARQAEFDRIQRANDQRAADLTMAEKALQERENEWKLEQERWRTEQEVLEKRRQQVTQTQQAEAERAQLLTQQLEETQAQIKQQEQELTERQHQLRNYDSELQREREALANQRVELNKQAQLVAEKQSQETSELEAKAKELALRSDALADEHQELETQREEIREQRSRLEAFAMEQAELLLENQRESRKEKDDVDLTESIGIHNDSNDESAVESSDAETAINQGSNEHQVAEEDSAYDEMLDRIVEFGRKKKRRKLW